MFIGMKELCVVIRVRLYCCKYYRHEECGEDETGEMNENMNGKRKLKKR